MQCDVCHREAVICQPYSGKHLCPVHFTKDFESKAKRTIRSHQWLHPQDQIAVVLGADALSTALLLFLTKLTANRRDIRISAISIDLGVEGCPILEKSAEIVYECGVTLYTGSFIDRYGTTVDKIVQEQGINNAYEICQTLKSNLVAEIAIEHDITGCAYAMTVDDISFGFFSDLLTDKIENTLFSSRSRINTRIIKEIMPFMDIPASEVYLYTQTSGISFKPTFFLPPYIPPCDQRNLPEIQNALNKFSNDHPGSKFALANLASSLTQIAQKQRQNHTCDVCGNSMIEEICSYCEIVTGYSRRHSHENS